jgi:subtilase family serine protease
VSGAYYVLAVADGYGAVVEFDEKNNVAVRLITVNK